MAIVAFHIINNHGCPVWQNSSHFNPPHLRVAKAIFVVKTEHIYALCSVLLTESEHMIVKNVFPMQHCRVGCETKSRKRKLKHVLSVQSITSWLSNQKTQGFELVFSRKNSVHIMSNLILESCDAILECTTEQFSKERTTGSFSIGHWRKAAKPCQSEWIQR